MLTIALAKGRLADLTLNIFEKCGFDINELREESRKLVFHDNIGDIRYIFVKPTDVPVYVHRGIADIGVAGKDTLLEAGLALYEMLDLNFGACKICLAGFPSNNLEGKVLKIATKYPRIAKLYFDEAGRDIEIIKLNGSIELAPLLELSDAIIDIVESGTTLKENGLQILDDICPVTARLVVNQVSLKTKAGEINPLIDKIKNNLGENN